MTLRLQPIAAQRERNRLIRAHAERVAAAVTESDHAPIPVAVVPANTRETEPLPPTTRQIFLDRLRGIIDEAFAAPLPVANAETSPDAVSGNQHDAALQAQMKTHEVPLDLDAILARSCATCRGECCTAGRDHAFLRQDSIIRIRGEQPALDADTLWQTYASHLPVKHYRSSCVYHTTAGCNLPRTLRSSLCNRYVCGGLTQLTSALASSGGRQVFVGSADSVHLRRMALVSETGAKPISLAQHSGAEPDAA